jgi:pimeloyl-ACP methyl ester carboxylesterase
LRVSKNGAWERRNDRTAAPIKARFCHGCGNGKRGVSPVEEVGRGRSRRLADPRGYTLGRDVADLEAIREKIGAERVVLIGHSYGGTLASAYAASHPERVAKMVLGMPRLGCWEEGGLNGKTKHGGRLMGVAVGFLALVGVGASATHYLQTEV